MIASLEEKNASLYSKLEEAEDFIFRLMEEKKELDEEAAKQCEGKKSLEERLESIKGVFTTKMQEIKILYEGEMKEEAKFISELLERKNDSRNSL